MNGAKVVFVLFICLVSLCAGGTEPASRLVTSVTGMSKFQVVDDGGNRHHVAFSAVEKSTVYPANDRRPKDVHDSWIESAGGPLSNHPSNKTSIVLRQGSVVPGRPNQVVGGIWSVHALCAEENHEGGCSSLALVFGAWVWNNPGGESSVGLFHYDLGKEAMRQIVRRGEEIPGVTVAGNRLFILDAYNPRAVNLSRPVTLANGKQGIDWQMLVIADGSCGPSLENASRCLFGYVEYGHRTKSKLFLIALEGMPELHGGTLSRQWNTTFFGPGSEDGSVFGGAGVIFTALILENTGSMEENEREIRYAATIPVDGGMAEITEICTLDRFCQ